MRDDCPFCDYEGPNGVLEDYGTSFVVSPLREVTEGHVLVIPKEHVTDALERPYVTGYAFEDAAVWAAEQGLEACNFITSVGALATQTVKHLHVHVLPRRKSDGLHLPWTAGPGAREGGG